MKVLLIKTDQSEAEISLYDGQQTIDNKTWSAGRQLSNELLLQIENLLKNNEWSFDDLEAIAVYKGPGFFTGLRIGMTVANTIAYSLSVPIVSETGEDWQNKAISRLQAGQNETVSMPEYGGEANITKPKK